MRWFRISGHKGKPSIRSFEFYSTIVSHFLLNDNQCISSLCIAVMQIVSNPLRVNIVEGTTFSCCSLYTRVRSSVTAKHTLYPENSGEINIGDNVKQCLWWTKFLLIRC